MKSLLYASLFLLVSFYCNAQIPEWRICNWNLAGNRYPINENLQSVNIIDFGAIANDGLPDDEAFASALESLNNSPGIILFPIGEFNFTETISLTSGIIVKGEGNNSTVLRFNSNGISDFFQIFGTIQSNTYSVSNAVKSNSYLVSTDAAINLNPDDLIKIYMDGTDYMFSSWALGCMAQIIEVDYISNDTIFLKSQLRHNFYADKQAMLQKIIPVHDVMINNLKILRDDAGTTQTSNIQFNYAYNCHIRAIESENCNFAHISISNSSNIEVSGCYIHHGFDYGEGGKAYGAEISASSGECLVQNNIFYHLRHSTLLQSGANGNVVSYNYSYDPYWSQSPLPTGSAGDLVLHGNYTYCNLFEGNIAQNAVIDDSHGQNGPFNTFCRNRLEKYGIVMNFNPATDSVNFLGNEITNTGFLLGNFSTSGNGHLSYGNNVKGSCTPTNTTDIDSNSLYLNQQPCYFSNSDHWPPIGYPAEINAYTNPAFERFEQGIMTFDTCIPDLSYITIPKSELFVFPNPLVDDFNISSNTKIDYFEIIDLYGRVIRCENYSYQAIQTKNLRPGVYFLKIYFENGNRDCIKLMKKT